MEHAYRYGKKAPGIELAQLPENEFPALPEDEAARIEASRPERPKVAAIAEPPNAAEARGEPAYRFIPFSEFVDPPPPLEWVWDQMIPRGDVTLLSGHGGVGKTLLAQFLGTIVSMPAERRKPEHEELFGRSVEPGRVVALFCEDNENELRRRQDRINARLGLSQFDLGGFGMISGRGHDNMLVSFDRPTKGVQQGAFRKLRRLCDEVRPSLVIVDNIAATFGGNENDRVQVRPFVEQHLGGFALEYDCAVLLLGHPSLSGMNSDSGMSGSTDWHNAVRSRMYMRELRTTDRRSDPGGRLLERKKANYAPRDERMWLRWNEGIFECVLRESGADLAPDEPKQREVVLRAMRRRISEGENLSPQRSSGILKRLAGTEEVSALGLTKGQVERVLDALRAAGEIHIQDYRSDDRHWRQRYQIGPKPEGAENHD